LEDIKEQNLRKDCSLKKKRKRL